MGPILDVRCPHVCTFLRVHNSRFGCTCNQTTVNASSVYIWPNTIETHTGDKSLMLQLLKGLQQALSVTPITHQLMVSCYIHSMSGTKSLLVVLSSCLLKGSFVLLVVTSGVEIIPACEPEGSGVVLLGGRSWIKVLALKSCYLLQSLSQCWDRQVFTSSPELGESTLTFHSFLST